MKIKWHGHLKTAKKSKNPIALRWCGKVYYSGPTLKWPARTHADLVEIFNLHQYINEIERGFLDESGRFIKI